MYTNIHLGHALPIIQHFLLHAPRGQKITKECEIRVIPLVYTLNVVMTNNMFTFCDTFWLQTAGTAMGTLPAPNWATLYMAIRELDIIPKYPKLQLYHHCIDEGLGIWTPSKTSTDDQDLLQSQAFQNDFNIFGTNHAFFQNSMLTPLEWEFSTRNKPSIFLDLTINLVHSTINTFIYEKSQNL